MRIQQWMDRPRGWSPPRRPVVAFLLAALLFELSLIAGVLVSPIFQDWMPRRSGVMDDSTAEIVRYRRSVTNGARDPWLGELAPPLDLRTFNGQRLGDAAFRGKKVALLFVRDGSG